MDTENKTPEGTPDPRRANLRPPWTPETAPNSPGRGGRPKGSGLKTLREAFTAELARAVGPKDARTIAEVLAEQAAKFARKGDSRYMEIIRRVTEGDRVALTGPNGEPLNMGAVIVIEEVIAAPEPSKPSLTVEHVNGNGHAR